jgi:hypothetical protein
MAGREYLDFELAIEEGGEDTYRVRVLDSPAGEARATFNFPLSPVELENFILRLSRGGPTRRRLESSQRADARALGAKLFDAVFAEDVGVCFRRSVDEAERHGKGLRLRLRLTDAPGLAGVPWEYLYSSSNDRFLALSSWTPLVRYLDLPRRVAPLKVEPPLRILVMIASPADHPQLDVESEWARLNEGLADLMGTGAVELHRLKAPTLTGLQRELLLRQYHAFHFIGHGGFDEPTGDGVLMMEGTGGRARIVPGRDLGTILHDHRSMRLAVLNACEGGRTSAADPFSGTAQSLVRAGIPAVVAMQFEISDVAAVAFAHAFYAAIALGLPVDASVTEARKAVFSEGHDPEWGTPVVYMRSPDGQIFDIPAPADRPAAALPGAPDVPVSTVSPDSPAPVLSDPASPAVLAVELAAERDEERSGMEDGVGALHAQADERVDGRSDAGTPADREPGTGTDNAPRVVGGRSQSQPSARVAGGLPMGVEPSPPAPPMATPVFPDDEQLAEGALVAEDDHIDLLPHRERTWRGWFRRPSRRLAAVGVGVIGILISVTVIAALMEGQGFDEYPGSWEDHGPIVRAEPLSDFVADGYLGEWSDFSRHKLTPYTVYVSPRADRDGDESVESKWWLGWDWDYLYVAVWVEDDYHHQPSTGNQIYRGDAVNINIGRETGNTDHPGGDDFQIVLSPGDFQSNPPAHIIFRGNGRHFEENYRDPDVEVGARKTDWGYAIEAAIPWHAFALDGPPAADDEVPVRIMLSVFDNDGETEGDTGLIAQTVIKAHVDGGFQVPGEWGYLVIED